MDFALDADRMELRTLTSGLLSREVTPTGIEAHEKSGRPYDQVIWKAMARAGLAPEPPR
ncbi:hypothetical protein [Sphaerimonospora thailandensis]|uniref:Uncharacterized protein n=1 Tax=Sphaerimonospora thailandensis TaxID=795644 RepID=A0A8J3RE60_9ACTN|nr:hypothetical protein [Sphaerimonospora thailandensis]GIH72192.1 hypothetical protein Mth01_44450 [Sphaerimonospora thailandensis]